uniref:Uncharacterized protein n=1 Tax=Rhizophora mucronata TaxID=61149 RepID=A0A2P2IMI1_RHIMU
MEYFIEIDNFGFYFFFWLFVFLMGRANPKLGFIVLLAGQENLEPYAN